MSKISGLKDNGIWKWTINFLAGLILAGFVLLGYGYQQELHNVTSLTQNLTTLTKVNTSLTAKSIQSSNRHYASSTAQRAVENKLISNLNLAVSALSTQTQDNHATGAANNALENQIVSDAEALTAAVNAGSQNIFALCQATPNAHCVTTTSPNP